MFGDDTNLFFSYHNNILHKNITWKDHIHTIEKRTTKNLGLAYHAKHY